MRELKFRVYGGLLKKEFKAYDNVLISMKGGLLKIKPCDWHGRGDDVFIEQYTGLKDKNGKEIYEGDIVRWKHIDHFLLCGAGESKEHIERVYWEEKDASFVVGDWFEPLGHLVQEDDIEVIGNIHENPELCGEEE